MVKGRRALSREETVEGYRASRTVMVLLVDKLVDACLGWGLDMLLRRD